MLARITGGGAGRSGLAAALLALVLLLPGLGNHDLWAPDEPRYAQVAREMLDGGDWLLPRVNGRIYTDKPPGWFWVTASLAAVGGGVGSVTARLPSVLAAALLAALMAAWGRRRLGAGTGLAAAAVWLSSYLGFTLSRSAHLDVLLVFFITLALLAAWEIRAGARRGLWLALPWLAMAGAVMVKGPLGLILPALILGTDRLLAGRPRDLLRLAPLPGLLLAVLPPVAWITAAGVLRPGYEPLAVLDQHALSRFTEGLHHPRPFWYFGYQIFLQFFPWAFLLPAVVMHGLRLRRAGLRGVHPGAACRGSAVVPGGWEERRFLLVWVGVVLCFFTLSVEKRGLYLLPLFPAAALLVGDLWVGAVRVSAPWRSVGAGLAIPALGLLSLAGLPWAVRSWGPPHLGELLGAGPVVLAVVGAAAGAAVLLSLARRQLSRAFGVLAAGFAVVLLLTAHLVEPALDPMKSARELGEELQRAAVPGSRAGMLNWRAAYLYYSGVRLAELESDAQVQEFLRPPGRVILLLEERDQLRLEVLLAGLRVRAAGGVGHRRMLLLEGPGGGSLHPSPAGVQILGTVPVSGEEIP